MDRKENSSVDRGDVERGQYANYFKVGHNAFEFLIDCGQSFNENEGAQIHTRIITSPVYAKALSDMLSRSVEQFEQYYGGIPQEDGTRTGRSR